MTHTPGPWHSNGGSSIFAQSNPGGRKFYVCDISGDMAQSRIANARLIAAAPDMLIALKEMMRQFEPDQADYDDGENYNPPDWLVLARDAIAKAEGKSAKAEWGDSTLTEEQAAEMLRKEEEES